MDTIKCMQLYYAATEKFADWVCFTKIKKVLHYCTRLAEFSISVWLSPLFTCCKWVFCRNRSVSAVHLSAVGRFWHVVDGWSHWVVCTLISTSNCKTYCVCLYDYKKTKKKIFPISRISRMLVLLSSCSVLQLGLMLSAIWHLNRASGNC